MFKAMLLKALLPMLKEWVDDQLDELEDKLAQDDVLLRGEVDDEIIERIIELIRDQLDIPDDIGGDED